MRQLHLKFAERRDGLGVTRAFRRGRGPRLSPAGARVLGATPCWGGGPRRRAPSRRGASCVPLAFQSHAMRARRPRFRPAHSRTGPRDPRCARGRGTRPGCRRRPRRDSVVPNAPEPTADQRDRLGASAVAVTRPPHSQQGCLGGFGGFQPSRLSAD